MSFSVAHAAPNPPGPRYHESGEPGGFTFVRLFC
jgi:hypothetical protein